MKKYEFENVKTNSDNTSFNENIILCDDCRSAILNSPPEIHTHDFYEIEYVFSGEGVAILNQKSYLLSRGSIVFCKPGDEHAYFSTNNLAIANLCIKPNPSQIQIFKNFQTSFINLDQDEKYEFEMLYNLLNLRLKKPMISKTDITDRYVDLIFKILFSSSNHMHTTINFWDALLYHISQNYSTITSHEAAKICNLSESAFYKKFKKDFGQTLTQYVDRIKLEKAKDLLLTTNININDIAYCVGFSHPTRFFRYFRSQEGITPLEYKRKFAYKNNTNDLKIEN